MLENDLRPNQQSSTVELPPIQNHAQPETIPLFQSPRPRELLPSIMARSPPGRSSTLPPLQRKDKPARPRKSSITKNTRKPNHERTKSKDYARRLSIEGRKALSAEPYGPAAVAQGKRWEDLLEAATSANEADSDRDLTPVGAFPMLSFLDGSWFTTTNRSPNRHPLSSERPFHPSPRQCIISTLIKHLLSSAL